ncbi:hypothetical protein F2Q68_00044311 [Brassica cretica]|uniref:Uncharacterized protein n=1 Tax=Brassica cretica TaxID=69181 RepID=A0A8S9LTJ3_BRACR|nr:hypothetical protein F2Q68_00044311 [Brassica cretica]
MRSGHHHHHQAPARRERERESDREERATARRRERESDGAEEREREARVFSLWDFPTELRCSFLNETKEGAATPFIGKDEENPSSLSNGL